MIFFNRLFGKKKEVENLTIEEEKVLSIFKEYGESKDDYTIIESREIDELPSLEDEERWIKDAESKFNNNGLEEDNEDEDNINEGNKEDLNNVWSKEILLKIFNEVELKFNKDKLYVMSELIEYFNQLQNKYENEYNIEFEIDLIDFIIYKNTSSIKKSSYNNGNGELEEKTEFSIKNQLIGIDYEFLDFYFNNDVEINNIDKVDTIYKGREDFNNNSYLTTTILLNKIHYILINDGDEEKIKKIFNILKDKCFENIGDYKKLESCFEIGYGLIEINKIESSLYYFNLMNKLKIDISINTIAEFYKEAAEVFIELNLKKEGKLMIDEGLKLNSKISFKKLLKLCE
jgi:hypothetical protein